MKIKFRSSILIIVSIIVIHQTYAQVPAIEWSKCYGGTGSDDVFSVVQSNDGGIVMFGMTNSTDGDVTGFQGFVDYWLVKTDISGNLIWEKCLGGSSMDFSKNISLTSDGGFVLIGFTASDDGDISDLLGGIDYWIVKTDSMGNIQWEKCLGGGNDDQAAAAKQTSDGGYIVIGYSNSTDGQVTDNHGDKDYWVVKLDSTGDIQWKRSYGGSARDEGADIIQTSDGGFIMAGISFSVNGDVTINHGGGDYWLVKLDNLGFIQWEHSYGGSGDDFPCSVLQTNDGGYMVAGTTYSYDGDVTGTHGSPDFWVVKTDNSGNLQWTKCYGGSSVDGLNCTIHTPDGGYFFVGWAMSSDGDVTSNLGINDAWFVKTDNLGNLQWQKSLGGTLGDNAHGGYCTSDGGYVVAVDVHSNDYDVVGNHGDWDYWAIKFGPDYVGVQQDYFHDINLFAAFRDDALTINFYSVRQENQVVELSDITGRIILQKNIEAAAGSNRMEISVGNIARGIYFVTLSCNEGSGNVKVFRQ